MFVNMDCLLCISGSNITHVNTPRSCVEKEWKKPTNIQQFNIQSMFYYTLTFHIQQSHVNIQQQYFPHKYFHHIDTISLTTLAISSASTEPLWWLTVQSGQDSQVSRY